MLSADKFLHKTGDPESARILLKVKTCMMNAYHSSIPITVIDNHGQ